MKNTKMLGIILGILLLVTGVAVSMALRTPKQPQVQEEEVVETLPAVPETVKIDISKSKSKDNTVVLSVSGLESAYEKLSYELSYETQGIVQGVTSAPIDISGKEAFTRDDIYLGTCSRNVCKPHTGVESITAVLVFMDTEGKKSQFTGEFSL